MTSKVLPTYAFTAQLATLEPPPSKMQQLLGAVYGNQAAMDDFVSVNAGTLSLEVFFSPRAHQPDLRGSCDSGLAAGDQGSNVGTATTGQSA